MTLANWRGIAKRAWHQGVSLLFPWRCPLCDCESSAADPVEEDAVGEDATLPATKSASAAALPFDPPLCATCQRALAPAGNACFRCGITAPEIQAANCSACRKRPPQFDAVVRLGAYDSRLREAILQIKHGADEPLAAAIADWFWVCRERALRDLQPQVVAPVAMHWRRRWLRETNSPEVVAERLALHLGVPLANRLLIRTRFTEPQGHLSRSARMRNVRDSFALGFDSVAGLRVLVVDDVMTTGATAEEVARTLKRAGARFVAVAVLARAETQ